MEGVGLSRRSQIRARASIYRRADDLEFRIIVRRRWVFVHIEPREPLGARNQFVIRRVHQGEQVKEHVAFALVKPIVLPRVLFPHHMKVRW